jgi:hypothetical protein
MKNLMLLLCLIGLISCKRWDNGKIKLSPTPTDGKLHKQNLYAPEPPDGHWGKPYRANC